uniref:DOD-type homing endonuclease domain-containing protein n=1 Tax=viral metagenome TaxID=1070528 RepID=A0A6M3K6R7_9ZZZZ
MKAKSVGDQGWDAFLNYMSKDVNLQPTIHERVQLGTFKTLLKMWMDNFGDNLPFIRVDKTVADMALPSPVMETESEYPQIKSSNIIKKDGINVKDPPLGSAIIVGRGPSLFEHKHCEMLANSGYKGMIVTSDGGFITLMEAGVIPDVVVCVDGAPIIKKYFDHPEVKKHGHKIKLVCATTINHEVYLTAKAAGMQIHWFSPIFDDERDIESFTRIQKLMTISEANIHGVPRLNSGGNCLTGDTLVMGNSHIFQINEALIGDKIWTFNPKNSVFEKSTITQVSPQGVNDVFELRTRTRILKATKNHRFLTLQTPKLTYHRLTILAQQLIREQRKKLKITRNFILEYCGINSLHTFKGIQLRKRRIHHSQLLLLLGCLKIPFSKELIEDSIKRSRKRILVWTHLCDIKIGDRIAILQKDPETEHRPFFVDGFGETTDDFMRIIGAFIGDGWLRLRKTGGGEISFAFPAFPREDKSRKKYIKLLEKTFHERVYTAPDNIGIYSKKLALMFSTLGLHKRAIKKTIPQWVFSLPNSQKMAFIEGLTDSDGHVTKEGEICFEFCNQKLVEELKALLICLGLRVDNVYCHIRKKNEFKGYVYINHKSWRVRITTHKRKRHNTRKYASPQFHRKRLGFSKSLAVDSVQSIKSVGKQEVFDISVEHNSNFIANGIVVHNSGACAWNVAMSVLKRSPVALIGIDLGYPESFPLEQTHYFKSVLEEAKGDVSIIKEAYPHYYHPTFKTNSYVDLVFNHYRLAFLELQKFTPPWYRLFGGTINCTESGTLFGPGINCMKLEQFLKEHKR